MLDLRPVGYVTGLLVTVLGAFMFAPLALDALRGDPNWQSFFAAGVLTTGTGGLVALACRNGVGPGLSMQQTFLLTTGVWVVLPLFGALPFMFGVPEASFTDALFEAMSGMTTTGTTVFAGLDGMPRGTLMWRAILQWLGGLGIVIVAMVFLPVMKVGGMQFFRSEGFDTLGKILPRALDIAAALLRFYLLLTVICVLAYVLVGMSGFDAVAHALTTVSTGGFSTYDRSFGTFSGPAEYVATVFMVIASLPFMRFVQLMTGSALPLWRDTQARAYLRWIAYAVAMIVAWLVLAQRQPFEPALREALFNAVSLFSGTGYGSVDVTAWGPFPFVVLFTIGLIGGCTSSTACSVKVFRYQVLFAAIRAQLRRIHAPSGVFPVRYEGRTLGEDVISAVMVFFTLFFLSFTLLTLALALTGLQTRTAITAAWAAIANIGPAFGPEVGPTGAVDGFPLTAKWLMIAGMLVGRLELISVYVLFTVRFWRA